MGDADDPDTMSVLTDIAIVALTTTACLAGFYLLIAALGLVCEGRWLFGWPLDLLSDLGIRPRR